MTAPEFEMPGARPRKKNRLDRGADVTRILSAVPALAVIAMLPARAEMFGPCFQPCGEKTSTLAVAECVQAKTNVADQRLNAAYKALQAQIDANQRQPLLAAQRLWV